MTRDFNNQRREDQRRESRSSSSHRYGEERSPRPARPRLNRDMVDRAWENGARQNHADYRTRSDNNSHPQRDHRQQNQYSAQHSRNYRKPYGNRQGSYRTEEHTTRTNYGSRPRSYESSMRPFNEQHYSQYERRGYSDRPNQAGYQSDDRQSAQQHNSSSGYQGRDQYRSPQRSKFDRDTRQPRSYNRDKRSYRNDSRPDTQNPRWQSRPARQRSNNSNRPQELTQHEAERELFEGDYEHFEARNAEQHRTNQVRDNKHHTYHGEERDVTRLLDGRNLKGSPRKQRRDAEFWMEIAHESDELVQQVESSTTVDTTANHSADIPIAAPTKGKTKSRTNTASAMKQERKTKVKQSIPKPRSTGPKPSQRGYKWPTPEE